MTDTAGERLDVEVAGGRLATYRLGRAAGDVAPVLAIHGITSSSRGWLAVADALGDRAALHAVDLRGRGASRTLPGPYGFDTHLRDMLAALDALGLRRAVVAGHSLGAYIAARLAVMHPERVARLVLVDGGLRPPGIEDAEPGALAAPFLDRLALRFPDPAAYRAWWAAHPAFATSDVDPAVLDAYADHDLAGEPPELHPASIPDAVAIDAGDVARETDAGELAVGATLLCAPRGFADDPKPLQPEELVRGWAAADPARRHALAVPDVNHYTIALGARGAAVVADEIAAAVSASGEAGG